MLLRASRACAPLRARRCSPGTLVWCQPAPRRVPSLVVRGLAANSDGGGGGGSAQPFMLSDIGEGIAEVEITQWFVKPGDSVQEFDKLCEVQSDKATVEISSPFDGTVESLAHEVGAIAKTGHPLLFISRDGGLDAHEPPAAAPSPAPAASGATGAGPPGSGAGDPAATVAAAGAEGAQKVLATPATRAIARQHGIELAAVAGSGRDGRVTKDDVRAHIAGGHAATPTTAVSSPPSSGPLKTVIGAEDRTEPIRGIRRAMFAQMTAANQARRTPGLTTPQPTAMTAANHASPLPLLSSPHPLPLSHSLHPPHLMERRCPISGIATRCVWMLWLRPGRS